MRAVTDEQPPYRHPGPPPVPRYVPRPETTALAAPPYTAPYTPAQHPQFAGAVTHTASPSRTLGIVALVLALSALIVPALLGGIAGYGVGAGSGTAFENPMSLTWDWSVLSPVRDQVLLGEIAFWMGTVLGTWAFIQGIVAIVTSRGRGFGIAGVVIAVVAPGVLAVLSWSALVAGLAAGSSFAG